MKNTEENIKKIHNIINSKCPVCGKLLNVSNSDIFKSNDVGFHVSCAENTDKEDIENLIDDVLDDTYGIKKEIITEGYRDTVLTRIDCGDAILYVVEFWNDNRTGFCFGKEYDSFEEAFEDFKNKQLSPKIEQVDKSLRKYIDNFDVICEGKDSSFLFRQTCGRHTVYVVGNWGENKLSVHNEVEFENDFEGAYKYFKSLQ